MASAEELSHANIATHPLPDPRDSPTSPAHSPHAPSSVHNDFVPSQYKGAFRTSMLHQVKACCHMLARLHWRNKDNYIKCAIALWASEARVLFSVLIGLLQAVHQSIHHPGPGRGQCVVAARHLRP